MPAAAKHVFAFSGVLGSAPGAERNPALLRHAMSLAAPGGALRLCYVPTAIGDAAGAIDGYQARFGGQDDVEFTVLRLFTQPSVPDIRTCMLSQDVIFVEGGSVVNLMAIWRAHGLRQILRECWQAGIVLAGPSAGSICWHAGGPTDSFRDALDPFTDGIGLLPFSNGVHDDFTGQPRRETYRRLVAQHVLPGGYASEDGVGLHYIGTDLHEAVTIQPGKRAWHVLPDSSGGYTEQPIQARLI